MIPESTTKAASLLLFIAPLVIAISLRMSILFC
jgi:hypothetical protein